MKTLIRASGSGSWNEDCSGNKDACPAKNRPASTIMKMSSEKMERQRVRKLERRLLREQRRLSRKEQASIDHYENVIGKDGKTHRKPVYKRPLRECRNYRKQKRKVASVHKKLKDLRTDYVHKVTRDITPVSTRS